MKRLTKHLENGSATHFDCNIECDYCFGGCEKSQSLVDRLAAYEDTGLEPKDIVALIRSPDWAIADYYKSLGLTMERITELAQADREGQCFIGPFVAMIEQSLSGGEMKPQRDQRFNGRYAVVYFDPKKWSSPLIDICGTPYNREEAEERMKVLKAALRREQDEKGGSSE